MVNELLEVFRAGDTLLLSDYWEHGPLYADSCYV